MTTPHRRHPSWADELLDLAADEATGRVVVAAPSGEQGWVQLRDGQVCGVSAAIRRPLLSKRLTAFGVLSEAQVRDTMTAIRDRPGTRLLDVVLAEQLAPFGFLEAFLRNTMAEQLGAILHSKVENLRYEPGRITRSPLLLGMHEVLQIAATVPFLMPEELTRQVLSATTQNTDVLLHRSVLAISDGQRAPLAVADACGLTIAETLQVIAELQQQGSVQLTLAPQSVRSGPDLSSWHAAPAPVPAAAELGERAVPELPIAVVTDSRPRAGQPPPAGASAPPPPTSTPTPTPTPASAPPVAATPPPAPAPLPEAKVVTAFTPAPLPLDEAAAPGDERRDRRSAMSALQELQEAAVTATPPPVAEPQPVPAPRPAGAPRSFGTRPVRPANPMESGDVLRELQSLGEL